MIGWQIIDGSGLHEMVGRLFVSGGRLFLLGRLAWSGWGLSFLG
jgi:hypothetical protein